MSAQSFLSELKRRQIYRGGVMYVVAGWVIVEVATTVFPYFSIPEWAIRLLIVVIMLGFPIALVALWMFESALPDPNARLHERRGNREGGAGGEDLAKLLQAERAERARESQELIAALAQLKGAVPGQASAAGDPLPPLPSMAPVAPVAMAAPPAATIAPRRPSRLGPVLVAAFLVLSVLGAVWVLGVPEVSTERASQASSEIAEQYMTPGYRYVERLGVSLLTPLLHKLGLDWSPHHVFTALMVLLALIVMRRMYRGFALNRRMRRVVRAA